MGVSKEALLITMTEHTDYSFILELFYSVTLDKRSIIPHEGLELFGVASQKKSIVPPKLFFVTSHKIRRRRHFGTQSYSSVGR
jgi:hypothetical protein